MVECNTLYVNNCSDLQNMQTGDASVVYLLNQTIDCTSFRFTPVGNQFSNFQGKIDGQGFSINNLTINANNSNYAGLFGYGNGTKAGNITFKNVQVSSNASYVAALFGYCQNCQITNITLSTTNNSMINNISGRCCVGGVCGEMYQGSLTSCVVENTMVGVYSVTNSAGDVLGYGTSLILQRCFNLGILSDANQVIVIGLSDIGGVCGYCFRTNTTQCGTHQGKIFGSGQEIGGVFGRYEDFYGGSEFYTHENVSVLGPYSVGGVFGDYLLPLKTYLFLNYFFSRSSCS